jgi:hypothetical protein
LTGTALSFVCSRCRNLICHEDPSQITMMPAKFVQIDEASAYPSKLDLPGWTECLGHPEHLKGRLTAPGIVSEIAVLVGPRHDPAGLQLLDGLT